MSDRLKLIIIFGLILVKTVVAYLLNVNPQTFENYEIAKNFHETGTMYYLLDGNVDYCHQFPLFGWILIVFQFVFGDHLLPVLMFQFILGGILSFFVFKLKRLIFPDHKNFGAEILLLLLANLHPFLLHYQFNVIHPVMLDSTMFISLLYVGMYYAKKEERGALDYLLLATITGICFLERFTLITALLPLIWLEFKRREKWRTVLILFASFLIFFVPWMSRNYFYTGKFQMTSGIHRYLWVGIQEETEGTNTLEQGESYYELFLDEVKLEWSGMTIDEQLSFYRTEYRETFRGDFSHVLKMWGIKVKNYFWFSKSFKNRFENNKDLLLLLMAARFMLLLSIPPAFILGYRSLRLLALTVIALGVLQGFFYIESRHFVPSIGVLMVVFLSSTLKIKKRLSLRNAKEMV